MKKLLRLGLTLSLATVLFTSCSSDDNSSNTGRPEEGGTITPPNTDNTIGGELTQGEHLILERNQTYNLRSRLIVGEGAKLTIPEGVVILGTGGTSAYIAVAQGGQIFIEGNKDNPVVMTSSEKERGSWGGLVLCGRAPINKGVTATAEVSDLMYGGDIANDNSGSIQYLRIEYAGANFNSEKEFNGLSMFGVGSGTVIQYVQAHEGSDDGFEWFGGTVSAQYLVSSNNDDDQFDWTEGWNGQENRYWYSKQSGVADRGFEADNNSNNRSANPYSDPKIDGVTLISAEKGEGTALKLREGTKGQISNIVLSGWRTGIDVEHDETIDNVTNGSLFVKNVQIIDVTNKTTGKTTNGQIVDVSKVLIEANNSGAGNGADVPEWAKGWTVGL